MWNPPRKSLTILVSRNKQVIACGNAIVIRILCRARCRAGAACEAAGRLTRGTDGAFTNFQEQLIHENTEMMKTLLAIAAVLSAAVPLYRMEVTEIIQARGREGKMQILAQSVHSVNANPIGPACR